MTPSVCGDCKLYSPHEMHRLFLRLLNKVAGVQLFSSCINSWSDVHGENYRAALCPHHRSPHAVDDKEK